MMPGVLIIILNWNNWQDTLRCLESVFQSTHQRFRVLLIDNASQNESIQKIMEWAEGRIKPDLKFFPYDPLNKPVRILGSAELEGSFDGTRSQRDVWKTLSILKNSANFGFAKGNNVGIDLGLRDSGIKYIMLLNNDTEITADTLEKLTQAADSDSSVGCCQPKIVMMDDPGRIDAVGISIGSQMLGYQIGWGARDQGQFEEVKEIFGVCAGAALYRSEMLKKIGNFDEDFFAYYEDVDLAMRARLAGWKSVYVPKTRVYHKGSASLGKKSYFKMYLAERNKYKYMIKNLPMGTLLRILLIRSILVFVEALLNIFRERDWQMAKSCFLGNMAGFMGMARSFRKRKSVRAFQTVDAGELKKWINRDHV